MALGSTVYDRAKKTGFLLGPRHRYEAAMEEDAAPETEQDVAGGKPPNLRDAGAGGETCDSCMHSEAGDEGGLQCMKYGGYPVTPNQVCDDFEEQGGEEGVEEGAAPPMPGGLMNMAQGRLGR